MSGISVLNVVPVNNPAPANESYVFQVVICYNERLQEDMDWKITYVGSAQSSTHDQVIGEFAVPPKEPGTYKFDLEADPPELDKIPKSDLLGAAVVLLTASYRERDFACVGFFVNNEYTDADLIESPPEKPAFEKIRRTILAKPRLTSWAIKWDSEESAPAEYPPEQPDADLADDDMDQYGAEDEEVVEVEGEGVEGEAEGEGEGEEGAEAEAGDEEKAGEGEDAAMEGVTEHHDGKAKAKGADDDAASDAGSEDLGAEDSGEEEDEEEEEEEEEGEEGEEGEGDKTTEGDAMDTSSRDVSAAASTGASEKTKGKTIEHKASADVMVH